MFIDKFPKLSRDHVESVEWDHTRPQQYDLELYELTKTYKKCFVINPYLENPHLPFLITEIPDNQGQCIVWHYRDQWIAKLFHRGWAPDLGYLDIEIPSINYNWRKNPDIDIAMTFFDSPLGIFEPDPWDREYTMVWYMDPAFNPTDDKIWVMTCEPMGIASKGLKDMGYLTPQVLIETNPKLPDLGIDLAEACPPYWDLSYECAYYLDTSHTEDLDDKLWVIKFTPRYKKPKDWKWLGAVTPVANIIYNPDVGILDYDIDLGKTSWADLEYENVYMLDRSFLDSDQDDIWAIKVKWTSEVTGMKPMGYIMPLAQYQLNKDLNSIDIDYSPVESEIILLKDWDKKFVWEIDTDQTEFQRIWAAKKFYRSDALDHYDQRFVQAKLSKEFDIFFISYNEPGAEENWTRLRSLFPWAKRVDGVKGIWAAHKSAADLSTTDMFWVVDADAWIVDDWTFDFEPNLFERDCTFIWRSLNPVNGLTYGHGGVKLFPKKIFDFDRGYLDISTEVNDKIKIKQRVSNENRFNTSELAAWRTAFRECYKLKNQQSTISQQRLHTWSQVDLNSAFAQNVVQGCEDAVSIENVDINDYDLLEKIFNERRNKKN